MTIWYPDVSNYNGFMPLESGTVAVCAKALPSCCIPPKANGVVTLPAMIGSLGNASRSIRTVSPTPLL